MKLAEARLKIQGKMTEEEKLTGKLMGLKFQIEDYFRSEKSNSQYYLGYFLKLFIELLDKKEGYDEKREKVCDRGNFIAILTVQNAIKGGEMFLDIF